MSNLNENVRINFFSSVTPQWLWYPYIPYGKLTVLQGDPGEGKSTFILQVAALLTKGEPMPDGSATEKPQKVLYQCAEDNVADTVKPRLIAAGADCTKIAYIVDDENELTLEDERIEQAIIQTGVRLFILDPLQAFLVQDGDMQSASRMRSVLSKLAGIAARQKCAVVLIGHMNKTSGGKNLYRGLGSIDIAAIARSVLMVARDEDDPCIRYMFPIKSSLAPEGRTIGFALERETGFRWLGVSDIDTSCFEKDILESKRTIAARYLIELLSEGDMPSSVVFSELQRLGISRRTVQTAKSDANVQSYKKSGAWYWRLQSPDQPVLTSKWRNCHVSK